MIISIIQKNPSLKFTHIPPGIYSFPWNKKSWHSSSSRSPPHPFYLNNRLPKFNIFSLGWLLGLSVITIYATDTRAIILHEYTIPPLIRLFVKNAETAHHLGIQSLKFLGWAGINPRERDTTINNNPILYTKLFQFTLSSPIGVSAGLDKNGEIIDQLFDAGASIVEIGGITPLPQPGNPKPRVFRIPEFNGLINRYGFNSDGADIVVKRLHKRLLRFILQTNLLHTYNYNIPQAISHVLNGSAGVSPGSLRPHCLLAIQLAKNKSTPNTDFNAIQNDYLLGLEKLAPFADILVVNVSSPNTPGLRSLQQSEPLTKLLNAIVKAVQNLDRITKPNILVKVSPDEDSDEQILGICQAILSSGVDGIIVGNTTLSRPYISPHPFSMTRDQDIRTLNEQGGYSGSNTFPKTLRLVQRYHSILHRLHTTNTPQKVIIACGGITCGKQVQQLLNQGASATLLYTSIVYKGIGQFTTLKKQLLRHRKLAD